MSFPIFFKMEIKKGWRKSCDFVISNPVSRVNWRDLIVLALHKQWTAQIHINLAVHTPSDLSAQPYVSAHSRHVRFWACTPMCRRATLSCILLYHSATAQPFESVDAAMLVSRKLTEASSQRVRTILNFHLQLSQGLLWETSNSTNQGSTASCRLEKLIQPTKQFSHPPSSTKAELHPHSAALSVLLKLN